MITDNPFNIILPKFKYPGKCINKNGIERIWHNSLLNVLSTDKKDVRHAMYKIALYFKREFRYDFVQYSMNEEDDENHKAFLFYDNIYYLDKCFPYGGFVMRYRTQYKDLVPFWALQWIWIHPYKRSNGLLQEIWPWLIERFGLFIVEGPYSRQMKFFLRRGKHYSVQTNYERLKIHNT